MERDLLTEAYLMVLIIVIFFVYDAIFRNIFRSWYGAFESQNSFPFPFKVRHVLTILGLIGSLFFDFRLLLIVFPGMFGILSTLSYRQNKESREYLVLIADGVMLSFCTIGAGLSIM